MYVKRRNNVHVAIYILRGVSFIIRHDNHTSSYIQLLNQCFKSYSPFKKLLAKENTIVNTPNTEEYYLGPHCYRSTPANSKCCTLTL